MSSGNIQIRLNYNRDDGSRPYKFGRPRTKHETLFYEADEGGPRAFVPVVVRDGRKETDLTLDNASFELCRHETSLENEDFYDQTTIEKLYYEEMADFLKSATGASAVQIYHHQVRNPSRNNGSALNVNTSVQAYADRIHLDTEPIGCVETFKRFTDVIGDPDLKKGRFVVLNAWRNISDIPIQRDHLAVLDDRSTVKPDDYITGDFFGNKHGVDYCVSQYLLNCVNSRQHRWYYFPKMTKDEVILFKMFDSDTSKEGRFCFHTAFTDPGIKRQVPCRESIEIRTFLYFPDHSPNTCPDVNEGIMAPKRVFPYNSGGKLY